MVRAVCAGRQCVCTSGCKRTAFAADGSFVCRGPGADSGACRRHVDPAAGFSSFGSTNARGLTLFSCGRDIDLAPVRPLKNDQTWDLPSFAKISGQWDSRHPVRPTITRTST